MEGGDAAWRARAEAADAWAQAYAKYLSNYGVCDGHEAMRQAIEADAARRRYEETCRG